MNIVIFRKMLTIIFLSFFRNLHPLNCQLLLFGIEAWNAGQNIEIVEAVHKFIKITRRFK